VPIQVAYPPEHARRSHFRQVRDPVSIVATVTRTVLELQFRGNPLP
jgi:hypothetical protein